MLRPYLIEWRRRRLHAYPAMLSVGLTVGIVAGMAVGRQRGLDPRRLYAALLLLTVPALVGSRLLYALSHWQAFRARPRLLFSSEIGGAALYGGLLLALACSWPLTRGLGLPFGAFWDVAAVTILVGMAFTKVGCLLGGCCAGRETAAWWGIRLPNTRGVWRRRIPAQPIESGVALLLLATALWWPWPYPEGSMFLGCLAGYAAARVVMERTRETVDRIGGWSVYGAISCSLLAVAVVLLWLRA